ncbi:hypothetical protein HOV93_48300 [Planctomycetes bacterium FF15]|uniref:Uncharacterized protein n=1 Tax=Bremerella alba TaxID=980252 RepID=A0A7V8VA16_9BACT|nr:hypothetical protein [Bremerella alba]
MRTLFCRRVLSSAANRTLHNVVALPFDGDRIWCDTFRFASLLAPYPRLRGGLSGWAAFFG